MVSDKLPVPAGNPSVAFTYNGVDFPFDERGFVNLTLMWKAAGSVKNQDPREWRRKEGKGFIADLAKTLDVAVGHIVKSTKGGKGGGGDTFAHWHVVLAYAKYLSHEFHRHVNDVFVQYKLEEKDPGLKMERAVEGYLKKGKDGEWIIERAEGVIQRKSFTSTLADHNCKRIGTENPFAEATRSITLAAIGKTPSEFKASKGLKPKARTRDHMTKLELTRIRLIEAEAEGLVMDEAADGNAECLDAVRRVSSAIKLAIASIKKKPA